MLGGPRNLLKTDSILYRMWLNGRCYSVFPKNQFQAAIAIVKRTQGIHER